MQECTEFEETKRPRSFADIKERLLAIKNQPIVIKLQAEKERILTV